MVHFIHITTLFSTVAVVAAQKVASPTGGVHAGLRGSRLVTPISGKLDASNHSSVLCRMVTQTTSYGKDSGLSEKETISCIPIVNNQETDDMFPLHLPDDILQTHNDDIRRGFLHVQVNGASIAKNGIALEGQATFEIRDLGEDHRRKLVERHLFTTGTKTLAIVRVKTIDSVPNATKSVLNATIFSTGTGMKTQYQKCSFGALNWVPASIGVIETTVQQPVSSFASGSDLITAAQQQIKLDLGIDAVSSLGDKVIMCLPPGTGDWAAMASVNNWRAAFNNDWCLSLSALMHEVGHTIGLLHANENGQEYQDYTGYMSASYTQSTWPLKCFNGNNNWYLGWYSAKSVQITPLTQSASKIKVADFVDYSLTASDEKVLISIDNVYYLQYNRAKSFNQNTEEKKDLLTVTQDMGGSSDLRAGLGVGQRFQVSNYKSSGKTLIVQVCAKSTTSAEIMTVSIGMDVVAC